MESRNIILLGGQLFNKGAQAMTFISVDEMKKRFPHHNIVLLSTRDYYREEADKKKYKFDILPSPTFSLLIKAAIFPNAGILKWLAKKEEDRKLLTIFQNADYVIDISGYRLSSDWGCDTSVDYCLRIKFATICGAKIYLMPQSFGPFDYIGKKAFFTKRIIKKCLPYAEVIMAREKDGYDLLMDNFRLNNVVLTEDMVLQNNSINIENIYQEKEILTLPDVKTGSVCIIPSTKIFKYGKKEAILLIYDHIIQQLKDKNKGIYFLIHSSEDYDICKKLYERYRANYPKIWFFENELNCLEFDNTVGKFDFIISSRYHAIAFSYRNAVPAIAFGWAIKYKELMHTFGQERYQFNIREDINISLIEECIENMLSNHRMESKLIADCLEEIHKKNVFDYIKS